MTKKHYIKMAKAISTIKNVDDRLHVAKFVGDCCKEDNSRFDWDTWWKACNTNRPLHQKAAEYLEEATK